MWLKLVIEVLLPYQKKQTLTNTNPNRTPLHPSYWKNYFVWSRWEPGEGQASWLSGINKSTSTSLVLILVSDTPIEWDLPVFLQQFLDNLLVKIKNSFNQTSASLCVMLKLEAHIVFIHWSTAVLSHTNIDQCGTQQKLVASQLQKILGWETPGVRFSSAPWAAVSWEVWKRGNSFMALLSGMK